MATQTRSQRQATAKRAAATRKRNTTKRSASATKASARRTGRAASAGTRRTSSSAKGTTRQAGRTASRGVDTAVTRLGAVGRQAQRALFIPIGAAATLGDKVRQTARTYTSLDRVTRELNRFERRGGMAVSWRQRTLSRRRRELEHDVRSAQREIGSRADGLRNDAKDQVKQLV